MEQPQPRLAPHEARLVPLWERMVRSLGIHTVNVLLERAVWEVSRQHPELALLERTDHGLSFEALEKSYAGRPQEDVDRAFNDLYSEMVGILSRLLGWEMAQRLSQELEAKQALEQQAGTDSGRHGTGGGAAHAAE